MVRVQEEWKSGPRALGFRQLERATYVHTLAVDFRETSSWGNGMTADDADLELVAIRYVSSLEEYRGEMGEGKKLVTVVARIFIAFEYFAG